MPQTLPTSPIVSKSSSRSVEHRALSMQFGNGYQQDVADGINNKVETWNITYDSIGLSDRNAILAVLDAAGSWDVINWTAPGGSALKYKLEKSGYTEVPVGSNRYTLTFKLKQVF